MILSKKTLLGDVKQGLFFLILLLSALQLQAQDVRFNDADKDIYTRVMAALEILPQQSTTPTRVMAAAHELLGTPYVGGTLEKEPETLTVALSQTDCILFVEACFCLAETSQQDDHSFEAYCRNLRKLRYRNGITDSYSSRIHYTSEWILQGSRRLKENGQPLLCELSEEFSQTPLNQQFSYMTEHSDRYPALVRHPEQIPGIAAVQDLLNQQAYYYIPKEKLASCLDRIQEGDMICYVTNVKGLDISHVALAKVHTAEGQRTVNFIHASSVGKKVMEDNQTLLEYVSSQKSCIGIRLIRF